MSVCQWNAVVLVTVNVCLSISGHVYMCARGLYCIKLNMFEHVSARVVAHDFGAAVFNLFVHE